MSEPFYVVECEECGHAIRVVDPESERLREKRDSWADVAEEEGRRVEALQAEAASLRELVTTYGTALNRITETDVGRGERMKQLARAALNPERGE